MLALGSTAGIITALSGTIFLVFIVDVAGIVFLVIMLGGAILCAVFAGLLYKGYHKV